jgi:hypothetical protein
LKELLHKIHSIRTLIDDLSVSKKELQERINALEAEEQSIRKEILSLMQSSNKRHVEIAGLAEVKVQKTARSYETLDESSLIEYLKQMGRYEDIVKTTTKISSAPLTKFLDELRSADAIPDCVKLKEDEDSLRITFSDPSRVSNMQKNFPEKKASSKVESSWSADDSDQLDSI